MNMFFNITAFVKTIKKPLPLKKVFSPQDLIIGFPLYQCTHMLGCQGPLSMNTNLVRFI